MDARLFRSRRCLRLRFSEGGPLAPGQVEDYAIATFTAGDAQVRLACSWRLHAGRDAVIEAAFYGTGGGAALRNVAGSFYDFTAERFTGTECATPVRSARRVGRRAAAAWAEQLAVSGLSIRPPSSSSFRRGARPDLWAVMR
jgi:predicted dehydrogenase